MQQRLPHVTQQMSGDLKRSFSPDDDSIPSKRIPFPGQFDGAVDNEFIDLSDEDYEELEKKIQDSNSANKSSKEPNSKNVLPDDPKQECKTIAVKDKESSNEDSDCLLDSHDDIDDSNEDLMGNQSNFVVCQWDKVSRSKNKWTIQLRNGIITNKGREYAFFKACGTLKW